MERTVYLVEAYGSLTAEQLAVELASSVLLAGERLAAAAEVGFNTVFLLSFSLSCYKMSYIYGTCVYFTKLASWILPESLYYFTSFLKT